MKPRVSSGVGFGRILALAAIPLLGAVPCAQAAAIHTETFSGGPAGWTRSGALQVDTDGEVLRGQFAAQGFPMPESGSFLATAAASDGAFAGDYPAAGIQLVGFSFMARDVLPSAALLRWSGPTSSFFRSFAAHIAQTGVWYRIAIPLGERDAGRWTGGTPENVAEALRAVASLEIQLTRAGMAEQRYWIDDVFVDAVPAGFLDAGEPPQLVWSRLRPQVGYTIEATTTPAGPWLPVDHFVASGPHHLWIDESAGDFSNRLYRLVGHTSAP